MIKKKWVLGVIGLLLTAVLLFAQTRTNAVLQVAQTWTAAQTFNPGNFVTDTHTIETLLRCHDTSGSGSAQSCTTSPSFTPVVGDCVIYDTTTANTGTSLTVNINASGADAVWKWQSTGTLAAGDVPANTPVVLCQDNASHLLLSTIGNAPSGGGSSSWSSLTNPSGNLSLTNSGFNSTFTQNATDAWTFQNTTAATASVPQSSPLLTLAGTAWVGAGASGVDSWSLQVVPAVGLNGNSQLSFTHTGTTTGHTLFLLPGGNELVSENGTLALVAAGGNASQLMSGSDITFSGVNSSNAITTQFGDSSSGTALNVLYQTHTPGQKLVIASMLKATAALTAGQTIKIDTANASSVVVATTSDTAAGTVLGFVANSPALGAAAQLTLPGTIILTPLLGTGTCTIGQFVINDTTTNGRVKCTSTYADGTILGYAVTAQASVGSAVSVYVWPM